MARSNDSSGEFGFLEWLVANVGIWIKRLGDAGGQRVNFDAGDGRMLVHLLRHEADEMADAAGRFQNAPARKPKRCAAWYIARTMTGAV